MLLGSTPRAHVTSWWMQLGERIGKGYMWLWPKQRPAANAAIQELLLSLSSKPGLLHNALPALVGSLLAVTLHHPADPRGQAGPGEALARLTALIARSTCSCNMTHQVTAQSFSAGRAGTSSSDQTQHFCAACTLTLLQACTSFMRNMTGRCRRGDSFCLLGPQHALMGQPSGL